jgi:hypothetical protein
MKIPDKCAIVLDPADNVATVLTDVTAGVVVFLKERAENIVSAENIFFGHKIAIRKIQTGENVVKYGQKIGSATREILPGAWVHLHNMASSLDADFRKRIEE